MADERVPIGKVVAVVEFPIYDGDTPEGLSEFPWFEYREPGITKGGELGTCVRKCKTISSEVVLFEQGVKVG